MSNKNCFFRALVMTALATGVLPTPSYALTPLSLTSALGGAHFGGKEDRALILQDLADYRNTGQMSDILKSAVSTAREKLAKSIGSEEANKISDDEIMKAMTAQSAE